MTEYASLAGALFLSYLAGSIPFSVIVGKVFFGKDPRKHGSGNAGGTNTFRLFGPVAGIAVVIGDVGKGVIAARYISQIALPGILGPEQTMMLCGSFAVIGHIWTIFGGFAGGKGVAAAAGMVAALYPWSFAASAVVFFFLITTTGRVSAGSIGAAVMFPLATFLLNNFGIVEASLFLKSISLVLALLIFFTHRANMVRLWRGEEKSFPRLMIFHRLFGWEISAEK